MHPYDTSPLLVLTAVGRSGSNAVRNTIGAHPSIDSTRSENNIIHDVLEAAWRNCTVESRRVALRVPPPRYHDAFRRLLLDLLWSSPRVDPLPSALLAFSNLTPTTASFLTQVLPAARILHLVRHGVEVVASRMRYAAFSSDAFEVHCERWAATAELAMWASDRAGVTLVRHEELLDQDRAKRAISSALSAVGLDWDARCGDELRTIVHPTSGDHSSLPHRRDRWREWSPQQVDAFERICGDGMAYFGYELPWRAAA